MEQLELFTGLEPIRKYLSAWQEAERTREIKCPSPKAEAKAGYKPAEGDADIGRPASA